MFEQEVHKAARRLIIESGIEREVYECASRDYLECIPEEDCNNRGLRLLVTQRAQDVAVSIFNIRNCDNRDKLVVYKIVLAELEDVVQRSIEDTMYMLESCFKSFEKTILGSIKGKPVYGKKYSTRKYKDLRKGVQRFEPCILCGKIFNTRLMYSTRSLEIYAGHLNTHLKIRSRPSNNASFSEADFTRLCETCHDEVLKDLRRSVELKTVERIRAYDKAHKECSMSRTCGVIDAHHDSFIEDDDRLKTTFMIGMTCGLDGVRKYLIGRGDITKKQSRAMDDDAFIEYLAERDL